MEKSLTYGGQAVLEGVMIRGQRHVSTSVRRPDGSVAYQTRKINLLFLGRLKRMPLVRGVLVLSESLVLGFRALTFSANVGAEAEGEELSKTSLIIMMLISLSFGIGLFFLTPVLASEGIGLLIKSELVSNLIEGLLRLVLLVGYMYLIGKIGDIRRVFMYHGAEHMTVHAQEHGDPLEIHNIRKYSTAHPRCGTAFLLTVVLVSIVVFVFIPRHPMWWLIGSRIVLVPVIAAISYEIIRFSGFHSDSLIVKLLARPNLALQKLTTRQPDDDQIEIAIHAMKGAIAADNDETLQAE